MNDFLIHFDPHADAPALAEALRGRPAVSRHPAETFTFPWGAVAVQPPAARGYAPLSDRGTLVACVGRPRFVGVEHEQAGDRGFNLLLRDRLNASTPRDVSEALTGMFAAILCDAAGARVLTDAMGFFPVYAGRDSAGRVVAVGTHLGSVAALAGRATDFDRVSLGDLLVNQYVTFPYTTRRGVQELPPASLSEFLPADPRAGTPRVTTLWQPCEPAGPEPAAGELEAELEQALRFAAGDVARGASRVALTLSGGLDSRLVLASLLRERRAEAITYATRENREVDVARRVARAAGVPHHIAWRGPEFYAELLPRAVALLGSELRGECHGFAIVDNRLDLEFDLVVGGFLSDTLFKGHYQSPATRERLRGRTLPERVRRAVASAARAAGLLPPAATRPYFWDVTRAMAARLQPDVRDAVADRRRTRLEQVRSVRPESAEEWLRFWPASRGDGAYGPQANARLFTADELFMHRRLIEVAARIPMREKVDGRLAKRVFPRLYGELGAIENSNTGVPAAAEGSPGRPRGHRRNGANGHAPAGANDPWNDVDHSWVDWELLQKLSPTWRSYRTALARSPALDVLEQVLEGGAAEFVGGYRDEAGFLFNRAAVQLAFAIDRELCGRGQHPAPPAGRVVECV